MSTSVGNSSAQPPEGNFGGLEPREDPFEDITQAKVPTGLAVVPKAILKALHLS
ncbi:MAG: hypothetical protein ACXVVQ_10505 [Solirubrobacteraceae bacterium]